MLIQFWITFSLSCRVIDRTYREELDSARPVGEIILNNDGTHYACNGIAQWLDITTLCDGKVECLNDADEKPALCSNYQCLEGYTKCSDNQQCIPKTRMCTTMSTEPGLNFCNDKSDVNREFCLAWECLPNYERCNKVAEGLCVINGTCDALAMEKEEIEAN